MLSCWSLSNVILVMPSMFVIHCSNFMTCVCAFPMDEVISKDATKDVAKIIGKSEFVSYPLSSYSNTPLVYTCYRRLFIYIFMFYFSDFASVIYIYFEDKFLTVKLKAQLIF